MIGAVKSGTTALDRCLRAHPQIYMSPIKELIFLPLKKKVSANSKVTLDL
ncbi:hypothetical protein [Synechococcus sp. PCC 7335]